MLINFNDRFTVLLIGFGIIIAIGIYLAFFAGVEEDKPIKSKHKK